jgi:hypothetical protein
MSFCSRGTAHVYLAVLALCSSAACSVFESQEEEFPNAGPNGPDSVYAGIGRGIPFGTSGLPPGEFRSPNTGALLPVSRSNVGSVLKAARAGKLRVVLTLAGSGDHFRNPDGTFNLAMWKSRIDTYRDVDFSPYVTEGLILAHYLIDEPYAPMTWGGHQVSRAVIEEMARYSKSIWPTLPTAVRAPPGWLGLGDTSYLSLDIAWAQWAGPGRGGGSWRTPEEFRDENVAQAKRLGLGLVFGLNYLNGGDGSSGVRGTREHPNLWQMSPTELVDVGTLLVQAPYSCAFLSFRYEPAFERVPEVRRALDSLVVLAATRAGTSCLRHDTTSTSDS